MATLLPDELIHLILSVITRSFPVPVATITLANCCLISSQWYRLAHPLLYSSPMINMGSKMRALSFLDRLVGELLDYELERMDSVKREQKPCSLIDQMRRLMFFGEGRWRHRASFDSRPDVVDRSTLDEILNRLWCTRIEALVFVELPFTNPLSRPLVNRYPPTLTTLILLTPLSHFQLLLVLRDLPSLLHLCIGSHDDTSSIPAEHHTLFSRDQLPSSNLRSFGISARTLEAWLRTGMPWYQSILNLLVVPSVRTITTLHLELADEDDERHLLSILGRPVGTGAAEGGGLFRLETVFLRGLSSVLMAESLSRLEGVRKLCLSSIYGTALRWPNPPRPSLEANGDETTGLGGRVGRRGLSTKNQVWQAIPSSVEELSIDITRLPDHGPWNRRSTEQLALTLIALIVSRQCPNLISLGSLLAEPAFEFGIHGPYRRQYPLWALIQTAQLHRIALVPPFWSGMFLSLSLTNSHSTETDVCLLLHPSDSFVVNPSATNWYR
ncbi:hypothetical protein VP01_1g4 [Puccinia sorghi]|uniref:Uncharacterized protein n=1 Tax=Puccinia sorghi TaxID=27349 RepID=A0A0L6VBZ5_9BASI|nr:hypothetical protein VP01_1g4 [Puccinia sorghi]